MRFLADPLAIRLGLIFVGIVSSFLIAVLLMRRMRRSLSEEVSFAVDVPATENSPLYAVIQQLKQQKYELQNEHQSERRRTKTSENISAAVLANLSSGVIFFTPDGLIRQANTAARQILGFASPVGMTAVQIFREAELLGSTKNDPTVTGTIQLSIREKRLLCEVQAEYTSPAGELRVLDITLTAVRAPDGNVLGTACLINDQTEVARIRRQQELRGEMSSEMALVLHNSLNAISGYARQLNLDNNNDPQSAGKVAGDILEEAAHLESTIGGFLSGSTAAGAAAGT